jgi:hypothetical protein
MATRNRPTPQGATLARGDRYEIWIGGYYVPMASAFNGDVDISDENTPVFGYDGEINTRIVNAGTLTMTAYEHTKMQAVYDVLRGVNPAKVGLRGFKPSGVFTVDVIRLTRHAIGNYYIKGELFANWNTVLKPAQAEPRSAQSRTLEGRCALPIEISVSDPDSEGVTIGFDVAAMTWSGGSSEATGTLASNSGVAALSALPDELPDLGGKFALLVEIQQRDSMTGAVLKAAKCTVTDAMVTSAGAIEVSLGDLTGTGFVGSDITHAWVVFVKAFDVDDIADNAHLLNGDGVTVRGRFDVTT